MPTLRQDRWVDIFGALADPIRLQIVRSLVSGNELSGAELARKLGVSRSLLCHHSAILVGAGLVARRKEGKVGYLRLNAASMRPGLKRLVRELA